MSYPRARWKSLFIGLGGVVVAAVIGLALIVAVDPGAATPKEAAGSYIVAAAGHRLDDLKNNSCVNDQKFIEEHADTLESFAGPRGAGVRFAVGEAKINGDAAQVDATINEQKYTFDVVREQDVWKVCLDYLSRSKSPSQDLCSVPL